ncbi:cofilin/actin-depolymerizing factor [Elysia marginata]|uniref:Cofilin/actin-depolymerizing factor n=1 Tax=Elysia marginata TaxID=1093978 RepID=A0AAV4IHS9_9GAST|nr:cofilin/actin-depolymerizing factor [Elysia marginata]
MSQKLHRNPGRHSAAASGVGVADECMQVFQEVKMKHKWLYIIYRISDDHKKIIVEEKATHDKTYNDFVMRMKSAEAKKQCRYAVFDVRFLQNDMPQEKLAFFLWSPDGATVKQKILYTTSLKALRKKMEGITAEIQCTDDSDLTMSNVLERCLNKYT